MSETTIPSFTGPSKPHGQHGVACQAGTNEEGAGESNQDCTRLPGSGLGYTVVKEQS